MGALLIIFALLNLLCQVISPIPSFFGNITCAVLFLTLAWLGVSAWSSKQVEVKELLREQDE
jgi:xanthine/uracil permease